MMPRIVIALLLGIVCAQAQPLAPGVGVAQLIRTTTAAASPTFDASSTLGASTTTTLVLSITTTHSPDLLLVYSTLTGGNAVSSVSGCSLTWTQRTISGSPTTVAAYYASASSTLSSCSVTITYSYAVNNTGVVSAYYGNGSVAPSFDVNASLPAYAAATSVSYSTTNAYDLASCFFAASGSPTPGAPTGFTAAATGANYGSVSYEALSSTQSSTSVAGPSSPAFMLVDAIKQ